MKVIKFLNLQGINGLPQIPIISVSGNEKFQMKEQYEGLSVQEFLTKPVKSSDLVDILKEFVKNC